MEIYDSSYLGKAYLASIFYESVKDNTWLVFGGVNPWEDEDNPPRVSPNLYQITDTFLSVYFHYTRLVRENVNGELNLDGQRYLEVDDDLDALSISANRPNAIYMECHVSSSAINSINSVADYRMMAVYHSVQYDSSPELNEGTFMNSNPNTFILDKCITFSPRTVSSLDSQTIKIVKRF